MQLKISLGMQGSCFLHATRKAAYLLVRSELRRAGRFSGVISAPIQILEDITLINEEYKRLQRCYGGRRDKGETISTVEL